MNIFFNSHLSWILNAVEFLYHIRNEHLMFFALNHPLVQVTLSYSNSQSATFCFFKIILSGNNRWLGDL
jgi:hypothetical protein